ncbi:MAG: hypothetical protein SGPRY_005457 [Prymnesium sp.]
MPEPHSPPATAASPSTEVPDPPSAGETYQLSLRFVVAGSLADFDQTTRQQISLTIANLLGVEVQRVVVSFTASSVLVGVNVSFETVKLARAAADLLSVPMSNASASSTLLGIPVITSPELAVEVVGASPLPLSSPSAGSSLAVFIIGTLMGVH